MHYTHILVGPDQLRQFETPNNSTQEAYKAVIDAWARDEFPMLRPTLNPEDFEQWQTIANDWSLRFEDVVVLGTGGSSLGAQTLVALTQGGEWHASGRPRLHFLDNLDVTTFLKLLEKLDIERTGFMVVSKSGGTAETLCQFLLTLQQFKEELQPSQQLIIVTQTESDSTLLRLGRQLGALVLPHPQDIGGRYSVFTVVGLLPALIAGVDIQQVIEGAQVTRDAFLRNASHPAVLGAQLQAQIGCQSTILFPYSDQLLPLTFWFRQLWAESLGKAGKGTLPVQALGPVDQHSQLQLYLDGPNDKLFTVLAASSALDSKAVNPQLCEELGLGYLADKTMGQLCKAECRATVDTLVASGCPTRTFTLEITEAALGAVMMHFFLETIMTAQMWKVNPFDQPAVETGKILTKTYLQEMG